jgi:hypothetical protein
MGYKGFSVEIFCLPFLVVRPALAGHAPARFGGPIFLDSMSEMLSFNPSRSFAIPKPFHHAAPAHFWQDNVGNSDHAAFRRWVDRAPARRRRRGQSDRGGFLFSQIDVAHFGSRASNDLAKFIAVKGSAALDEASLTVNVVDATRPSPVDPAR